MTKSRLQRWLTHALVTPLAVRRAFPPATFKAITDAIGVAEAGHSGEIRFAVEAQLPWSYLRRNTAIRQRAVALFAELRIWDTEHNNGVLLYLNLADRAVEIVADRGIAARVPPAAWDDICLALRERCKAGEYETGAIEAVRAVGGLLQQHFALAPGQKRINELPDEPVER